NVIEHALRGGIDPMQVLDHQHHRRAKPAKTEEEFTECFAKTQAGKLRGGKSERFDRAAADHEAEQIRKGGLLIELEPFKALLEPRLGEVARRVGRKAEPAPYHFDQGHEGDG